MAFEEAGIELMIQGLAQFQAGLAQAQGSVEDLGDAEEQSSEKSGLLSGALESLAGVAKGALVAGAAAAAAGIAALGAVLVAGINGALENEQMMARLEAQLRATGGASGLTMEDLAALGAEFQNLAGGTDDTIYAIESVGLKFSNITKDVMPQFIQATLDMAAVTGQDATAAAQQLAMALEDPAGALGRLRRAGVMFTDAEEKQIKAMQAAGNQAGAQQLILDKLANTMGGAAAAQAETLAGKWEIFKNRMGEAAEAIGMALLPVLTNLFDTVIAPAIPLIETIAEEFGQFMAGLSDGSDLFSAIYDLMVQIFGPTMGAMVMQGIGQIWDAITNLITFIQSTVIPALQVVIGWIVQNLPAAFQFVADVWTTVLQPALAAIAAFLIQNIPPAVQFVTDVWNNVLRPALQAVADFIITYVVPAIGQIIAWLAENLPPAIQAASDFFNGVIVPALRTFYDFVVANIVPILTTLWTWLQTNLPAAIQTLANFWGNVLFPALNGIWNYINGSVLPILKDLVNLGLAAVQLAMAAIEVVWREVLKPAFEALWKFINESIVPIFTTLANTITNVVGPAIQWLNDNLIGPLNSALQTMRDAIQWVTDRLNDLSNAINSIHLPDWLMPGSPTPFEIGLRGIASATAEAVRELDPLLNLARDTNMDFTTSVIPELYVKRLIVGEMQTAALPAAQAPGITTSGGGPTTNNNITVAPNYYGPREEPAPAIRDDVVLAFALL